MMEHDLIKLAMSQGLYAALFVMLLLYVLRENAKREDRLLKCLETLGEKYDLLDKRIEYVEKTVTEIKEDIKEVLRSG